MATGHGLRFPPVSVATSADPLHGSTYAIPTWQASARVRRLPFRWAAHWLTGSTIERSWLPVSTRGGAAIVADELAHRHRWRPLRRPEPVVPEAATHDRGHAVATTERH